MQQNIYYVQRKAPQTYIATAHAPIQLSLCSADLPFRWNSLTPKTVEQ